MCKIKLLFYIYRDLLITPQRVGDIMPRHFVAYATGERYPPPPPKGGTPRRREAREDGTAYGLKPPS